MNEQDGQALVLHNPRQASLIGQALPCRMFCQATGFGGTVQEGRTVEDKLRARDENPDEAVEKVGGLLTFEVINADQAHAGASRSLRRPAHAI